MAHALALPGEVRLSLPADLGKGALLLVRLVSAARADAPSETLAESGQAVSGAGVTRLPFVLHIPLRDLPPAGLLLEAELRLGGGPWLRPGDFLSTRAVLWSAAATAAPITIPLERIS